MKTIAKISLSIVAGSVLFLTGCNSTPEKNTVAKHTKLISEESLGLRKDDLYSEQNIKPEATNYSKEYAGSGKTIARAFQDAPPMIPHDTEGMLPITIDNNQCVGCHMPEVAIGMNATPIPKSHFTNFRPWCCRRRCITLPFVVQPLQNAFNVSRAPDEVARPGPPPRVSPLT